MLELLRNTAKWLFKLVGRTFELVIFLTIVLLFLIRSYWFQTELAKLIASYYSFVLDTEVTIDRVQINGLESAELINLFIADQKGDTLLHSPKLSTELNMLSLSDNFSIFNHLTAENTRLKIQKYEGDTVLNIQFIADYFASDDTTASTFRIKLIDLILKDIHFSYHDWNVAPVASGIDFSHLDVSHLSGKIKSLRNKHGVTSMYIDELKGKEQSGFDLNLLKGYFLMNEHKIKLEGLQLITNSSNIDCKGLQFNYRDISDFSDFVNSVHMKATFNPSRLYVADIGYFVPDLQAVEKNIKIQGGISGVVNDLRIDNLYLGLSPVTFFRGSGDIKGLPYTEDALFYLDIHQFQTSAKDITEMDFTRFGLNLEKDIKLSSSLNSLGLVNIEGVVEGFFDDFQLDLAIHSEMGIIKSVFEVKMGEMDRITVNGNLKSTRTNLGKIFDIKELGSFSSDINLSLRYTPEQRLLVPDKKHPGKAKQLYVKEELIVEASGQVTELDLMNYRYNKIQLDGRLHNADFVGKVNIDDENLRLQFDGEINLNEKDGQYLFKSNIEHANLYALLKSLNNAYLNQHPDASVSAQIQVNGHGNSPNTFDGSIDIFDIHFFKDNQDYFFDKILISSYIPGRRRNITIESQFAYIEVEGAFSFDSIGESIYALGYRMFPSIVPYKRGLNLMDQRLDLTLDVRDVSMLTALFLPELSLSTSTSLSISYNSRRELLEFAARSKWLEYGDYRLANIVIDTTQKFAMFDPFYTFDVHVDSVIYGKIHFENVTLGTNLFNDNVRARLSWHSADSLQYAFIDTDFSVEDLKHFSIEIHPSVFYDHRVGKWDIKRDAFVQLDVVPSIYDNKLSVWNVRLDNLLAINDKQSIRVFGNVTENVDDKLRFELANFKVENINPFAGNESLSFFGEVSGSGYVSDVYHNLFFDAGTNIENFRINDRLVGNIETGASWNPSLERIELSGEVRKAGQKVDLRIVRGNYYPKLKEDYLDFEIQFTETDLKFANAFIPEGISNLSGAIDGRLILTGSFAEPLLESKNLFLRNVGLNVDMLNTSYFVSGRLNILPDMIYANALPLTDKLGAKGFINLTFSHQNFDRYNYELFSWFNQPFMVMNTTYRMNPLYYGNAFATGDLNIEYDYSDQLTKISVNAKTARGTNVTLPLYGSEDVVLQEFITFVNTKEVEDDKYDVNLEGISLNLSLDLTEDANIQLVFDEKVGDAMRGTGVGHIDMYIDQYYDFYMFGNYTVSEGSYLFTLRDLINKRFKVKKGSTINWYGDPYEADLDLVAIYSLKTNLYDIMPENTREQYRQKLDVDCELHLTNSLFNPNLNFDIQVPKADENAKTVLRNLISEEAERNKQVFALLMLNKFLPGEYNTGGSSSGSSAVLGATTSEMLSNQLSNMLSKFSDDFDIGLNYRPGGGYTSQEVALALSTQLFDDRLTIKTNVGVSHQRAQYGGGNSVIGDVDIEYVLNEEGNLSVRAFNRSNQFDITRQDVGGFTQGVGIFYKESFDTFDEFLCKIGNLFVKKENECRVCIENCRDIIDEADRKACFERKKEAVKNCKSDRK
jgi:hypothetical protein